MNIEEADHRIQSPPVFLPAHLEYLEAKAAILLYEFEKVPDHDTEALVRAGLAYKAVLKVHHDVAAIIEHQQEAR